MSNPMMYRANRHPQDQPTDLERYGEAHIAGLFRQYLPMKDPKIVGKLTPSYDFGPMIEDAARMSEKIDFFESRPGLLDQVVFGIACPELCHRGVKDVVENRRLVALLLMRHFKKFGGLCLPPLEAGREVHVKNVRQVKADMAARREPTLVHYPNWRRVEAQKAAAAAAAETGDTNSSSRGDCVGGRGRGGGNVGRGGSSRGGNGANA